LGHGGVGELEDGLHRLGLELEVIFGLFNIRLEIAVVVTTLLIRFEGLVVLEDGEGLMLRLVERTVEALRAVDVRGENFLPRV
jgi:hypothetical protein